MSTLNHTASPSLIQSAGLNSFLSASAATSYNSLFLPEAAGIVTFAGFGLAVEFEADVYDCLFETVDGFTVAV